MRGTGYALLLDQLARPYLRQTLNVRCCVCCDPTGKTAARVRQLRFVVLY